MTTISKMRCRGNVYIASGFLSPFRPTGCKELTTEQAENAFKNKGFYPERTGTEINGCSAHVWYPPGNVWQLMGCLTTWMPREFLLRLFSAEDLPIEKMLVRETQKYHNKALRYVRKVVAFHFPKLLWRLVFRGYKHGKSTAFSSGGKYVFQWPATKCLTKCLWREIGICQHTNVPRYNRLVVPRTLPE